jgi:hypothetical protein
MTMPTDICRCRKADGHLCGKTATHAAHLTAFRMSLSVPLCTTHKDELDRRHQEQPEVALPRPRSLAGMIFGSDFD